MDTIVESWTVAEDDPRFVDAEIEEATDLLEKTEALGHVVDFGDDNEPEPVDAVVEDEERPAPTILEAEARLDKLRWRGKASRNLPSRNGTSCPRPAKESKQLSRSSIVGAAGARVRWRRAR